MFSHFGNVSKNGRINVVELSINENFKAHSFFGYSIFYVFSFHIQISYYQLNKNII